MIARPSELRDSDPVADIVRGNTVSALVSAALFLYFGFNVLAEPTETGAYGWSAWVFYHALRFGGIGFAIVAGLSMMGRRLALIVDGLVSVVTGLVFVPCAIGMLIDGGDPLNVVVIGVLGVFMVMSGIRDVENWRRLAARTTRAPHRAAIDPDADTVATVPGGRTFRSDAETRTTIAAIRVDETQPSSGHDATRRLDDKPNAAPHSVSAPPGSPGEAPPSTGFLAAMGKQPPPPPA